MNKKPTLTEILRDSWIAGSRHFKSVKEDIGVIAGSVRALAFAMSKLAEVVSDNSRQIAIVRLENQHLREVNMSLMRKHFKENSIDLALPTNKNVDDENNKPN